MHKQTEQCAKISPAGEMVPAWHGESTIKATSRRNECQETKDGMKMTIGNSGTVVKDTKEVEE